MMRALDFFYPACLAAAFAFFVAGYAVRTVTTDEVFDNKHNWRALRDTIAKDTDLVDGFRTFCNQKYGLFSEPHAVSSTFHWEKYGTWPSTGKLERDAVSSITSVPFALAGVAAFYFEQYMMVFPLVFVGAGSFLWHGYSKLPGRTIDHMGIAMLCFATAFQLFAALRGPQAYQDVPSSVLCAAVALGMFAVVASVDDKDASTVGAVFLGSSLVLAGAWAFFTGKHWKSVLCVLASLATGTVLMQTISPPIYKESECTGDLSTGLDADIAHAGWHICAFLSFAQIIYLAFVWHVGSIGKEFYTVFPAWSLLGSPVLLFIGLDASIGRWIIPVYIVIAFCIEFYTRTLDTSFVVGIRV